jgi:hypothetical protein
MRRVVLKIWQELVRLNEGDDSSSWGKGQANVFKA